MKGLRDTQEAATRPRLLVLSSTFPRWRGDATPPFVLDLCRQLAREFDVYVLVPHAPRTPIAEVMDGVNVRRFRYLPDALETLAYGSGIPERLRRAPLSALQVPCFVAAQFVAALRLARVLRPAAIHAHWILPQGVVARLVSGLCPGHPPVLCTLHGSDVHGLNRAPWRWIKTWTLRGAAGVTVVSDALRGAALALGAAPERVHVAPMGVDAEQVFRPAADASRPRGIAVFVGRLVAGKGADVLLDAWARLPAGADAVRLVLVGDGPTRGALEAQSAALGLVDRVEFAGALPPAGVADRLRAATVAVFPFTGPEGLGLVVAEAQACGCPVVASDIPAVRDTIVNDVTGLLAPPGNADALARALQQVLSDPVLAERLARAGRVAVQQQFCWGVAGARYRDLLRSLAHTG